MLEEGTATRNFQRLAEDTESIGASLNATASSERTTVSVSGSASNTEQLVDLLADTLLHRRSPTLGWSESDFSRRHSRAETLQSGCRATEESAKIFYGSTPYARVAPSADEIRAH